MMSRLGMVLRVVPRSVVCVVVPVKCSLLLVSLAPARRSMRMCRRFRLSLPVPLLLPRLPLCLLSLPSRLVQIVQRFLVRSVLGFATLCHDFTPPFVRFPRSLDGSLTLESFRAVSSTLLLLLVQAPFGLFLLLAPFRLGLGGMIGVTAVGMLRMMGRMLRTADTRPSQLRRMGSTSFLAHCAW